MLSSELLSKFDIVKEEAKILSTQDLMNQVNEKIEQNEASAVPSFHKDEEEEEITDAEVSLLEMQVQENSKDKTVRAIGWSSSFNRAHGYSFVHFKKLRRAEGVRMSHRAIMNRLSWQWEEFPFESGEMRVFKISMTFVIPLQRFLDRYFKDIVW